MRQRTPVSIMLTAMLAAVLVAGCAAKPKVEPRNSMPGVNLRITMRNLWDGEAVWMRIYIVSALAGLPDVANAAARLMTNQDRIGDAIRPYYGDSTADRLTGLLRRNVDASARVVSEAKAGHDARLTVSQSQWTANNDSIAALLAAANPNWNQDSLKSMLDDRQRLTTNELVVRLNKDYAADIDTYNAIQLQAEAIADTLAYGIIKQFPQKFPPTTE